MHRAWVGVVAMLLGQPGTAAAQVRPGIDVLLADSAHLVRGRAVALLTNHAGVDARGRSDVDRLREAGVTLVALFSPEHGFRGTAAPGERVGSSRDSATGLPIYSLYGRTVAPADSMLRGVDLVLIDLPDAGARYFTYLSTAVEVLAVTARLGIPVLVLDRPNPLGGMVQGNVLRRAHATFVGRLEVPMRHGLTLGELVRLAVLDLAIPAQVTVVPAAGWRRAMLFDATGLPFVPPSPNLPDLEALLHYPGTCLFEGTNLSVGRGSGAPFRQVGAPWLDARAVLARLPPAARRGVALEAVRFTPARAGDGKFNDTTVAGIRLTVTDRARYDATRTALELLAAIRAVHPDRFAWSAAHFDRLAGDPRVREALARGVPVAGLVRPWAAERAAFLKRSNALRLYPE